MLWRIIGECGDVRMDPLVLKLGTIQFSRQVHVLAVLIPEVEPQPLLHKKLGESCVSRSGCLPLSKPEPRFSCRTLRSLFVVPPTPNRLQFGNYFATICANSSILNACTRSNIERIFKIWHQEKIPCFFSRLIFHSLYSMSVIYIGAYLWTKFEMVFVNRFSDVFSSVRHWSVLCN
jgi:hypothetical protein